MLIAKIELIKDKVIFKIEKFDLRTRLKDYKVNELSNYKTKYRIFLEAETEDILNNLIKEEKRKLIKLFLKDVKEKQKKLEKHLILEALS